MLLPIGIADCLIKSMLCTVSICFGIVAPDGIQGHAPSVLLVCISKGLHQISVLRTLWSRPG